jgi:hydroxypyruvate isomerase
MGKIRQSFSWWCVAGQAKDPEKFLRAARQIGYEAVELIPQELWDTARQAGLMIAAEGVGPIDQGFNRRENHAALEDAFRQKVELAVRYQIPNLIVFSGNRAGLSDEEGAAAAVEGLKRLVPLAEAKGVTLVMELLNSKVDHKDYQCDHTAWGAKVIDLVGSPRVKLLYDIYHMQIMEGDVIRTLRDNMARIGHIHTAGNPGRNDLDSDQELYYPAIMRAIAGSAYHGLVGQEFVPKGPALEALRAGFELCAVE